MASPYETNGAFSWVELRTSDPEKAKPFYSQLLGWQLEPAPMGNGRYTVVKVQGQAVGGMMAMPPDAPPGTPPHWGVYITVADVDATAARARQLGGKVPVPPQEIPEVGRFAVLQDPQGAVFCIIRYNTM